MIVSHIAAECFPVLKAGGLGDVVGSLPKYLEKEGVDAKIIVPYHASQFVKNGSWEVVFDEILYFGYANHHIKIHRDLEKSLGFDLYLIEVPGMFPREKVYGYNDDPERFIFFQTIALLFMKTWKKKPDIVHCHDHHTGLIPFLMKYGYDFDVFKLTPSVFTIHNGEYTGQMGWNKAELLPLYDVYQSGMMDWENTINPITTGIKNAWLVTTVSDGYLLELAQSHNSTGKAIQEQWMKSVGIVNGIDDEVWNPEVDPFLESNYGVKNVEAGKKKNKNTLCFRYGLNPDVPLLGFIGRMVGEKGADFMPQAIEKVLQQTKEVSFMIVGSGQAEYEGAIEYLKYKFPKNINTFIGYDESLAHLVYAGADYLMMPSRVEPCGLNQLYSMNYGTIPLVRKVGGLKDTVGDINDKGEGFTFIQANYLDFSDTILRAVYYPWKKGELNNQRKKIMEIDHSWSKSAKKYIEYYQNLLDKK